MEAVKLVLAEYEEFTDAQIVGEDVDSGVDAQPLNQGDTYLGAYNRAVTAKATADLGIGIESGIMGCPLGKINFTAVVLAEKEWPRGREFTKLTFRAATNGIHYGCSSGFPVPYHVMELLYNEELDINAAVKKLKLTDDPKIGSGESGFLGLLTQDRITRKTYTAMGLHMALISYRQRELYRW